MQLKQEEQAAEGLTDGVPRNTSWPFFLTTCEVASAAVWIACRASAWPMAPSKKQVSWGEHCCTARDRAACKAI